MSARVGAPAFRRIKVLALEDIGIDEERRTIQGYASTAAVDRENEVIHPEAFEAVLARFFGNPIVTWMHWWHEPIGRVLEARAEPRGLWFRAYISDKTQRARDTWGLIVDRVLSTVSVGFDGLYTKDFGHLDEQSRWHWTAMSDLYEIAVVTIPANPEATFRLGKSLGLDMEGPLTPGPSFDEAQDRSPSGRGEQYGTDEEREEARALADIERARTATLSVANITRHWAKSGGAPSPGLMTACVRAASSMAGSAAAVVKAGQVLSGANRGDLRAAETSLEDGLASIRAVIARHEESVARRGDAQEPADAGKGVRRVIRVTARRED